MPYLNVPLKSGTKYAGNMSKGKNQLKFVAKIIFLILPLPLIYLFAHLTAEGVFNFGGGEKDIILVLPLLFWYLVYVVVYAIFWIKKKSLIQIIVRSILWATGILIVAFVVLYFVSLLGIA